MSSTEDSTHRVRPASNAIRRPPLPVTIVTGALGAGKTTVMNAAIDAARPLRVAVIVNEFGDIGVDGYLLSDGPSSMLELTSGCLCCSIRGELDIALARVARSDVDHLLVETTGVADPGPVIESVAARSDLMYLDAVLCVVDARNIAGELEDPRHPEIGRQIELASTIALSKTDLITEPKLADVRRLVAEHNPVAEIHVAQQGQLPLELMVGADAFAATGLEPEHLEQMKAVGADDHDLHVDEHDRDHAGGEHEHEHTSEHEHEHEHGNGGHHDHHDHDGSHAGHHHADIESISAQIDGDLDLDRISTWLYATSAFKGPDLSRIKGILAVDQEPNRVLVHGVRGYLEIAPGPPWNDQPRSSTIVAIGHDLNQQNWQSSLERCRVERHTEVSQR